MTYGEKSASQPIFVVSDLKTNLLGLPAIIALKLSTRIDTVETTKGEILLTYLLDWETLRVSMKSSYSLNTPRGVPPPLRQKTKEELDRMVSLLRLMKLRPGVQGWSLSQRKTELSGYVWTFNLLIKVSYVNFTPY